MTDILQTMSTYIYPTLQDSINLTNPIGTLSSISYLFRNGDIQITQGTDSYTFFGQGSITAAFCNTERITLEGNSVLPDGQTKMEIIAGTDHYFQARGYIEVNKNGDLEEIKIYFTNI